MTLHRLWKLSLASAIAAVAFASAPSVSASNGASQHPARPADYVPLLSTAKSAPAAGTFMDYNGGPVMPSNTDYMVLWSPGGTGAYPVGYIAGISQWFTDLAHDSGGNQNTDSVTAQYQDLTGALARYATTFGGVLLDTQPYPAAQCPVNSPVTACLTDAQIQSELERFVGASNLKKDLSHEYFLMTPPHVENCFGNDPTQLFGGCSAGEVPSSLAFYCAYHENTTIEPFLIYANDPYVPGNPGCDDGNHPNGFFDGELSGGLSHEQNESVSDPIPNDAWTIGVGRLQGFEVGDVCDGQNGTPLGTAPNGADFNQVINGHLYWYQEEWSNAGRDCLQRLASVGTLPTATFNVTAGSGLTLNFDASGSTPPSGIDTFVWQFNDAFAAQTVATRSTVISHTFPSAGAYSVGLTVIGHGGLSAGTGGIVVTGQDGVSTAFTSSATQGSHGRTVNFNALFSTVSAQPVLVDFWDFGDGSVGAGANPTHTYATAGKFVVTLVQFSGVGSAFPGAGAGPIVTRTITVGSAD